MIFSKAICQLHEDSCMPPCFPIHPSNYLEQREGAQ